MIRAAIAVLAAPFISLSLAGCGGAHDGGREAAPDRSAPVRVRTATVQPGAPLAEEVPGSVEAVDTAILSSRMAARVEQVMVEEGRRVKRGDLLVRLEAADLRARIESARAVHRAALAQRDRIRALLEREAATRRELEQAEAGEAAAAAAVVMEEAQLVHAEIRAPFASVVTRRLIQAGDLATPGQPLIEVQTDGQLRVAASLSAAQAARLAPGGSIEVELEGGRRAGATISIVAPAADPATRRVLLKADLAEGSGARPGSFARLLLPAGDPAPDPVAPRSALVERGALTGVFVVEEGRARLRWIRPGQARGDAVPVRAGLRAGETIVLAPAGLVDGAAVEPLPADPAR